MKNQIRLVSMSVAVACLFALSVQAEVKTEEKSQFKMEGLMGKFAGMFAGKAAKEGIVNSVAVKDNRKMTMSEYGGEIIDLGEKKVYQLDAKKKTYEVVTFAEIRRRLLEQQEKAKSAVKEESKPESSEKQLEIDFSLKESGQKKAINGFDCREVVMTIVTREKGKTLEQSGGMVMTSNIWLAPLIKSTREIAEFEMKYLKALDLPFGPATAETMAAAFAMFPGMKDMMGKMQAENVNMDGTAILTETLIESVRSPEQAAREQKSEKESGGGITSIGGLGGMLGRKMMKKKDDGNASTPPDKNRSAIMRMNHELLKVETSVPPDGVAIPAGYKEKK
jgi:hypothetical protein